MNRPPWIRAIVVLLVLAAIVATLNYLPVREYLVAFLAWAQANPVRGGLCLAFIYIPACLFFIPGSLLTLGAGFAFGLVWGTAAVSVGSVLGATAAFLTGRTLARSMIEKRVARNRRFAAVDHAVAAHGFKIVLMTRLSPIFPFNLLNYAYGLTKVRLADYVLASWIGMLPGTIMYVYLGSAIKNLADLAAGRVQQGAGQTALFFVGLLATIAVTVYITRVARQALNDTVDAMPATPNTTSEVPSGHPPKDQVKLPQQAS